uniref:C2H2-type domain-containing protein n=1 Tax=Compsopogon caeruleus TaxID=31354 RepID=A0A7S1XD82_9RHOD|mmetsp:Transcript_16885/g.34981  ORF Transcript_16885/g.34981 Transcript_16885/m.34981 type:complete len:210 (+) Transcript_16885:229-858(+)|eukprot:CAMPEP_0184682108 /NCGR_PEP_ID=MMETSP0312-20130426/5807_1 /TAXON_ID=31354 /ORGANISM="Compsopogon coeruleus, Strain SAG 36.94" /LENGTH=209 /DNA_ID=CAMNT_0027133489 /DNA_START=168 /DNA_END=797 /DNA_ORIENTATION=-
MNHQENLFEQSGYGIFELLIGETVAWSGSTEVQSGLSSENFDTTTEEIPSPFVSKTTEALKDGKPKKRYSCLVCGKAFSWRQNRNTHMRIHTNRMPHSCKGCHKKFKWCSSMKTHRKKCPLYVEASREQSSEQAMFASVDQVDQLFPVPELATSRASFHLGKLDAFKDSETIEPAPSGPTNFELDLSIENLNSIDDDLTWSPSILLAVS